MQNTSLSSVTVINRGPLALPVDAPSGICTTRDQLIFSGDIHRLMAADIEDILRDSVEKMVTINDLKDKGWTRAQIDRHAAIVFAKRHGATSADDNGEDDFDDTPGPSRPAGPSSEAEPTVATTLRNHLVDVLCRNDAIGVRIDLAMQNMQHELRAFREQNNGIRQIIASLEQANA